MNRSPLVIALLIVNSLVFAAVIERVVFHERVLPGVRVANATVGGNERDRLLTELNRAARHVERRVFTAEVGDVDLEFAASEALTKVDVQQAALDIQRAGRSGNPIAAVGGMLLRRTRDDEVRLRVRYNERALDAVAQRWVEEANIKVRDAGVQFADGKAVPISPVIATGIRLAPTRVALAAAVRDPGAPSKVALTAEAISPTVTLDVARRVANEANELIAKTYRIKTGPTEISLKGSQLIDAFRAINEDSTIRLSIDTATLRSIISGRLDSATSPPVDATFRPISATRVDVVPSKDGKGPDIDHIAKEVLAGQTTIMAPLVTSHPDRDTEWAESLGITELVASFTSHHPCCAARVTNIHTAAKYLDGAVIEPGEVFSLNDLVGARTEARGFVPAPVFYGEFTEDFGGGVSQLATTSFNAAFWGGFEIITHKPHSIYFDRYPMGREATVNYPSLDLKWRNNSKHGVFVDTSFNSTGITVALYGDREGKRVRETVEGCSVGPIVDTRDDPRCINVLETIEVEESELTCPVRNPADDPNNRCAVLKAGERANGVRGHLGYSVEFFRTITVEGQAPKVERFSWRYRMLPNVVLVGDPARVPPTTTSSSTTSSTAGGATTTTGPTGSSSTISTSTPP